MYHNPDMKGGTSNVPCLACAWRNQVDYGGNGFLA